MKTKYYIPVFLSFILSGTCSDAWGNLFHAKVDSIQIVVNSSQLRLPGESFDIGVLSFQKNGKTKKTVGFAGGFNLWWKYKIDVIGGSFQFGKIKVNDRLWPSKGKYIEIKISPRKHPEMEKNMLVPLNNETAIIFRPTVNFDKAPGSVVEGEIVSKYDNGAIRIFKKLSKSYEARHYSFSTHGGKWERGKFYIEPEFLKIENHRVSLRIQSLRNLSVADTFSVLLDYKHNYRLAFKGDSGSSGFSGSNGNSGGRGGDGSNGGYGQDGEPGYNAPDIGVWADLYFDSLLNCNLLYVYTQNFRTGEESRYLINTDGGKLSVASFGGDGGRGGNGGNGGDGGRGNDGEVWFEYKEVEKIVKKPQIRKVEKKVIKKMTDVNGVENETVESIWEDETYYVDVIEKEIITIRHQNTGERGGNGGNGGGGGFGAPGGDGGNIYFYFTNDSRIYENLFVAQTAGGFGGAHGNGGSGGQGGQGGYGEPNGSCGFNGLRGPEAFGWASDGKDGKVFISLTDEFYIVQPNLESFTSETSTSDSSVF